MLKVLLITTIIATGMTTTTTFDSMERCLQHREQVLEQSTGVSATCVYEDKKQKTEVDYLAERLGKRFLILFDAMITKLFNDLQRKE
tara:strand:- start:58 stop:318 length:261 start_codon:yes stop_codon:yes gene_type:complete